MGAGVGIPDSSNRIFSKLSLEVNSSRVNRREPILTAGISEKPYFSHSSGVTTISSIFNFPYFVSKLET